MSSIDVRQDNISTTGKSGYYWKFPLFEIVFSGGKALDTTYAS